MDTSIFTDKTKTPNEKDLVAALGKTYQLWQDIVNEVYLKYPNVVSEWKFPGQKHGWSFKMKDKKRSIIYLLPRDKRFMVAFNFGQKAFEKIMESNISNEIKDSLEAVRAYVEGRGIRIEVKNQKPLKDISELIDIKLAF